MEEQNCSSPADFDLLDGNAIYELNVALAREQCIERCMIDFRGLKKTISGLRAEFHMRPGLRSIASMAVDSESKSHVRMVGAVQERGWIVDIVNYLDAAISFGSATIAVRRIGRPMPSLASRLVYVIASQERFNLPSDIVVISHDYQVALALLDFSERVPGSKVAFAFFKRYWDSRCTSRLPQNAAHFQLWDLEPYAKEFVVPWQASEQRSIARTSTAQF